MKITDLNTLHPMPPSGEKGAVLITALMFVVILTLIGVTAVMTTTMEERMAGNSRDRNVAFQAAEIALRDAERDILCLNAAGTGSCTRTMPISGQTGAMDTTATSCSYCLPGVYLPATSGDPVWVKKNLASGSSDSVQFGSYTGATNIVGVAIQPRYLIEVIRVLPPGESLTTKIYYYRITARGFGANANTQVTLQEVYRPFN